MLSSTTLAEDLVGHKRGRLFLLVADLFVIAKNAVTNACHFRLCEILVQTASSAQRPPRTIIL